jgi:hypothetical protein
VLAGLLGEEAGQITLRRVLPGSGLGPEVEISFQANGVLLGVQTDGVGTYLASPRPDGSLFGSGQGMLTTPDGEVATWTGQGIVRRTGDGTATAWRGTLFYQTRCERLRALNGMAVVFEFDVDEQGKTVAKVWEWR